MEPLKLLVDALRSGEYLQTKCTLSRMIDEVRHDCCLGVACQLYIKHVEPLAVRFSEGDDTRLEYIDGEPEDPNNWRTGQLPTKVRQWLGFKDGAGSTKTGTTLMYLNDTGTSFKEIADVIERGEVLMEGNKCTGIS